MSYHQYIIVDAIPGAVWSLVWQNAQQHGTVLVAHRPQVLVAQTEGICYVYAFSVVAGPVQKTRLDLAITRDVAAAVASAEASDVIAAMDALPNDSTPQDAELAQTHLDTLRRLISPLPEAVVAKKAHEAQEHDAAPLYGVPVVTLGKVWFFFFIAGGIFSAALLLALNWWNMGYRRRALMTLTMVALPWAAFSLALTAAFNAQTFETLAGFAILPFVASLIASASLIVWQARQQRHLYAERVTAYGKPSAWAVRNILLTFTAVVIGCIIGYKSPDLLSKIWPDSATSLVSLMPVAKLDVYEGDSFTIQYPPDWNRLSINDCHPAITCLLSIKQGRVGGIMQIERSMAGSSAPENMINSMITFLSTQEGIANFHLLKHETVEIDGHQAAMADYTYTGIIEWGFVYPERTQQIRFVRMIFVEDGLTQLYVGMDVPIGLTNTVDAIFDSLHFLTPAEAQ